LVAKRQLKANPDKELLLKGTKNRKNKKKHWGLFQGDQFEPTWVSSLCSLTTTARNKKSYSAKVWHPAIIFITFRAIRLKFNQGPTIRANIVIRPRRTSSHENRPCQQKVRWNQIS
jgi:hypothetical protein